MKYISTIAALLFLFFACKESENIEDTNTDSLVDETAEISDIDSKAETNKTVLIIEGKDIWVRSEPFTGEVVMKLNTGDECKILDQTEKVQVRDMFDRWYKIEFQGKTGWVFGSQTNLSTGEGIELKDFKMHLGDFIPAYRNNNDDLSYYIHEKIGNTVLFNPGVYCGAFGDERERYLSGSLDETKIFNTKPVGDFCEGFPGVEDGMYYWKIKSTDLPTFVVSFDDEGGVITGNIDIPKEYLNNMIYKVQIITDEFHNFYLYFINVGNTWYLICEDHCDCSA
jgi:hypothetical protein